MPPRIGPAKAFFDTPEPGARFRALFAMPESNRDSASTHRVPALYLDYGADAQLCGEAGVELCERSMRFRSRWYFEIGTQLAVACVEQRLKEKRRVRVEGVVVWCEAEKGTGMFDTTLFFFDLPEELKRGLREFSEQIAARELEGKREEA